MLQAALTKVIAGIDLDAPEAQTAFESIISDGNATSRVAAFLTGLRMKGETEQEMLGAAKAMLQHATPVRHSQTVLADTCGTGGDGAGTFNISTTVAFVLAAAGIAIGKHGNRAVTSKSGSADVLEALGARIDLTGEQVGKCIDEVGIGFLFAQKMHPAMKAVAPVRRELGFRTIFNLLGPLTNPARAHVQIIGVFDPAYAKLMAQASSLLGVEAVAVVHNSTGLDELAPLGTNHVVINQNGEVRTETITAADGGLPECSVEELRGADASGNAEIIRKILSGEHSAATDTVCLNAGLGFMLANKADALRQGIEMARSVIGDGSAQRKVEQFVEFTCDV